MNTVVQLAMSVRGLFSRTDWLLFVPAVLISLAGVITMNSFVGESVFALRQMVWIGVAIICFFIFSNIDLRFLRRTGVVVGLFIGACLLLLLLFVTGHVAKGAQSWFRFGFFSFQPSDPVKLVLILMLAKYFTRRHIEIAHLRHIIVSGLYALILFILVLLQPDFGSAIILFLLWFGMVMVSGISKKHFFAVCFLGLTCFALLWTFAFQDYQKQRIQTFINPLADVRGAGYNAFQSMIAVGSGQLFGKGIGYGTQSKLRFLPEYQTDFIFAAFAEEWGFFGSIILLFLFGVLMTRIIILASRGGSNFETLFGLGVAIFFFSQLVINFGMNTGLLPVTGITVPFMSYGGSHLVVEFSAIGMLSAMARYSRPSGRLSATHEIVGIQA